MVVKICKVHGELIREGVTFSKTYKGKDYWCCKACRSLYDKLYRKKNPEKKLVQSKEWKRKNKEKILNGAKKYREENREKINGETRLNRLINPDKYKKATRKWREKNKEHIKLLAKNAVVDLKNHYVKDILETYGFKKEDITPKLIELKRDMLRLKRRY